MIDQTLRRGTGYAACVGPFLRGAASCRLCVSSSPLSAGKFTMLMFMIDSCTHVVSLWWPRADGLPLLLRCRLRMWAAALCLIAVTMGVVGAESVVRGDDWPQFRGPAGGGLYAGTLPLPTTWGPDENVLWKVSLPGAGSSSPAIWDGKLVLTAYDGYALQEAEPGERSQLRLLTLCFDAATGRELWRREHSVSPDEQEFSRRVAEHGYATPTAALNADGVFVYFGVSGVAAYGWDGYPLWTQKTGSKTAGFGTAASPILFENLVIVNASIEGGGEDDGGAMIAFDQKTGELKWKVEEINKSWSTPTLVPLPGGGTDLVLNQKDFVYGFDPQTGAKRWSCQGVDDYVVPLVVAEEGIAYCFGGRQNQCVAVRCGGSGDVTDTHRLWAVTLGANVTSPVIVDGRLYCAHDKSIALCVDTKDGSLVYRERLPTSARVYASVVAGDGKLYMTTRDQGVVVVKPSATYEELARNTLDPDSLFNAGPALADGRIFFRTNSTLYCIGE